MRKIEDCCGDNYTKTAKENGIVVVLHKKTSQSNSGGLGADNPLEINLYLNKNDNIGSIKEILVRLLTHSFIEQMYEFHFRLRERTLFEDIFADECLKSIVSLMVAGKKIVRVNCAKALDEAVRETVFRLSQKQAREKLIDLVYGFFQEYPERIRSKNIDIIENREQLITKILSFLPNNPNDPNP